MAAFILPVPREHSDPKKRMSFPRGPLDHEAWWQEGQATWPDYRKVTVKKWQSRTQYEDVEQAWNTYPRHLQKKLNSGYNDYKKDANKKQIEVIIKDKRYVIDFEDMTQHNKEEDPGRIRDIRLKEIEGHVWFTLSKAQDSKPCALSGIENALIEEGLSERADVDGAQCMVLEGEAGSKRYIDRVRHRLYEKATGTRWRGIFSLPGPMADLLKDGEFKGGYLRRTSAVYRHLVQAFEETKSDGDRGLDRNDDLRVEQIKYAVNPKLFLQWYCKWQEFGDEAQVLLGWHGTAKDNVTEIVKGNFDPKKIGNNTKNFGWFGKGIYFGRRAYTSLAYNDSELLLACVVVVRRVYACDVPDGPDNAMRDQDCKDGFDAHISPTGEELVIFNVRQILPCYIFELNQANPPRGR